MEERYTSSTMASSLTDRPSRCQSNSSLSLPSPSPSPSTVNEIEFEIKRQDTSKSCGADGLQIRYPKALVECPAFMRAVCHLYTRCLVSGKMPFSWNETEIHLLIKDTAKPRDTERLRPITFIYMFRKVFERLLLSRCEHNG